MKSVQTSTLLKLTLWLDAAVCAALAVLQLLGGSALAQELALPRNLLLATGVFLLPWSAILLWLTRSPAVAREWVIWVIAGNALWALGALGLLLRRRWAMPLFAISLAAVLVQMIAVYVFTPAWEASGAAGLPMTLLIVGIAIFLFWYARRASSRRNSRSRRRHPTSSPAATSCASSSSVRTISPTSTPSTAPAASRCR